MRNNRVKQHMRATRQSTMALDVPRSMRPVREPILLRLDPGKMVPVAATCLFREDAVTRGRFAASFTMDETAEVLLNPVTVRVTAYLVPWLAFERFAGRDEFEASYSKKPLREGDAVIPFIENMPRGNAGEHPVLDALGRHAAPTLQVSTQYIEAYNLIANYRYREVSADIGLSARLNSSLVPAIRERGRHKNIVPSWDQAAMEGAVDINLIDGTLPVHGIAPFTGASTTHSPIQIKEADGNVFNYDHHVEGADIKLRMTADNGTPMVNVDLGDAELKFSLAGIQRAQKMQAWAKIRKRYNGLSDDAIINKLMDGITMPDLMFEQPIELGSQVAGFGFSKRFATDSENLDKSVVSGAAMISMEFATPRIPVGGVVMFIAEIQPEMLFERQADPFLTTIDVDEYPQFMRDDADEQKVEYVFNRDIDSAHSNPNGVFGYQGINDKWAIQAPRIGTGYFQPMPITTFDENRARIWDTSPVDPSLGEDWYVCSEVDKGVFQYSNREPFECSGALELLISGRTVFGERLIEGADDYEKISEIVPGPDDQIDQA